jgi:hypothetical protein
MWKEAVLATIKAPFFGCEGVRKLQKISVNIVSAWTRI